MFELATAEESTFRHDPLTSDKAIRILSLFPSRTFNKPISCGLDELPLVEVPESQSRIARTSALGLPRGTKSYEAISYVWGNLAHDHVIRCNGRSLTVSRSCFEALQHLRARWRKRRLWIDAVCIDQSSVDEKSKQVALMGDVYQLAKRVIIWLGVPGSEHHGLLLSMSLTATFLHLPSRLRDRIKASDLAIWTQACRLARTHDKALRHVSLEWFNRIWTLQELLLAADATVVLGKQSTSWRSFSSTLWALYGDLWERGPNEMDKEHVTRAMFMKQICDSYLKKQKWAQEKERKLGTVLKRVYPRRDIETLAGRVWERRTALLLLLSESAHAKNATVDHDRVFGLFAILKAFFVDLQSPDYNSPIFEVYRHFTAMVIQETRTLYPLTNLGVLLNIPDQPSWVPNYAEGPGRFPTDLQAELVRRLQCFREGFEPITTSGELHVEGLRLGRVCKTSDLEPIELDTEAFETTSLASWPCRTKTDALSLLSSTKRMVKAMSAVQTTFPGLSNDRIVLMLVLESQREWGDRLDEGQLAETAQAVSALTMKMSNMSAGATDYDRCIEILDGWSAQPQAVKDAYLALYTLQQKLFDYGWTHLVLLSDGSAGWARQQCEVGDIAYSCFGGSRPLILRPKDGGYQVISVAVLVGASSEFWPLDAEAEYAGVETITLV